MVTPEHLGWGGGYVQAQTDVSESGGDGPVSVTDSADKARGHVPRGPAPRGMAR